MEVAPPFQRDAAVGESPVCLAVNYELLASHNQFHHSVSFCFVRKHHIQTQGHHEAKKKNK